MAAAASTSSSMVATAVLVPRFPSAVTTTRCSALPPLPPRVSTASFSSSVKLIPESKRFSLLQTKASEETVDAGELFTYLKEKLPKIMELVGLGYAGWFIYRYLLFKSSRKELATDIEALKSKITGTE